MKEKHHPRKEFSATVLIVDDAPANLAVVVDFLEEHGLRVVVAQDGKEGLQRAAFIKPDLILLDVMMPGMSGFEVCQQLKSLIDTRDIPVIFMTALADTASKLEGFKAGGVDYITKPLSMDEMLARVMAHVALRMTQIKLNVQNQKLQHEAAVRLQTAGALEETRDELKTVYKRLEQAKIQLLSGARLAAIGTLSCGAVRRIAQPLDALKNSLASLETGVAPQPGALHASRQELAQLEGAVRALQELAVPGETGWRLHSVVQVLDDTLHLLRDELGATAKITRNYGELPAIVCRAAELMQVFMNLLINAAQATLEAGEIRIAAGCGEQEIWVDIADTGAGIAPEHIARIFDPFFTTRPGGKGAGLGLSLAFAAIKKHHGRIEVNSTPGAGSTFRVWLPLQQPAVDGVA